MNEDDVGKVGGSGGTKLIAVILAVIIVIAGLFVIHRAFVSDMTTVYPNVMMNITKNGTIVTYTVTSIDYKYSLDYFHVNNMVASVMSIVKIDDGTGVPGNYYHQGPLSDILNNTSSPLIYYDVDNNNTLTVGDIFVSDLNSLNEANLYWIELSLWIVHDGQKISCGV